MLFVKHNEYAYISMSNIYMYIDTCMYRYICDLYIYIYMNESMYVYISLMKVNYDDIVLIMKFSSIDSILV